MPAPLSLDLRRRILEASRTLSASKTAARFDVGIRTVQRLRALSKATGSVAPKTPLAKGPAPLLGPSERALFERLLREAISMTQAEMARRFTEETQRPVRTVHRRRCARSVGAHAKKKSSNAAQRDRADIAAERAAFAAEMTTLDASKLVFVDESGIRQGERVSYGYAFKGERCYETAPLRDGSATRRLRFAPEDAATCSAGCGRGAGRWLRGRART